MTPRDLDLLPIAVAGCLIDALAFAWMHQWKLAIVYLALAIVPVVRKRWEDRQSRVMPVRRARRAA